MSDEKISAPTLSRAGMWQNISTWLFAAHPSVLDVGERRRAQLIATLSLIISAALAAGIAFNPTSLITFVILLCLSIVSYFLSRTRFYIISAYLLTFGILINAFLPLYTGSGGSFAGSVLTIAPLALVLASGLLPFAGQIAITTVAALATFFAPLYSQIDTGNVLSIGGALLSFGLVVIGIGRFVFNTEKIRLNEIRKANQELEEIRKNLEVRVSERTQALALANQQSANRAEMLKVVADVARSAAVIQELEVLLNTLTQLMSVRFKVYHVGIFLVDENKEFALLRAANSDGGTRMLSRKHRLRVGEQGIVGYVTSSGKPRIALDVGDDAVFFNNPDLPETHSEMALPLMITGEMIGAIDLQSTEPNAFTDEDVEVLTILADQLAITIQNARSLEQTRHAIQRVEQAIQQATGQEWIRFVEGEGVLGYRYDGLDAMPLSEPIKGKSSSSLDIPLQFRGQTLGVLRLNSLDPGHVFTDDETIIAQAAADRAIMALENARLLRDAQQRAARERLLSESSARMRENLDIESVLKNAAQELHKALGNVEAEVWIGSDQVSGKSV